MTEPSHPAASTPLGTWLLNMAEDGPPTTPTPDTVSAVLTSPLDEATARFVHGMNISDAAAHVVAASEWEARQRLYARGIDEHMREEGLL